MSRYFRIEKWGLFVTIDFSTLPIVPHQNNYIYKNLFLIFKHNPKWEIINFIPTTIPKCESKIQWLFG